MPFFTQYIFFLRFVKFWYIRISIPPPKLISFLFFFFIRGRILIAGKIDARYWRYIEHHGSWKLNFVSRITLYRSVWSHLERVWWKNLSFLTRQLHRSALKRWRETPWDSISLKAARSVVLFFSSYPRIYDAANSCSRFHCVRLFNLRKRPSARYRSSYSLAISELNTNYKINKSMITTYILHYIICRNNIFVAYYHLSLSFSLMEKNKYLY